MLPLPWDEGQLHLFQLGGRFLLFDVASSSLFSLSPVAYAFLSYGRKCETAEALSLLEAEYGDEVWRAKEELESYHASGKLLNLDPALTLRPPPIPYLKALCLNLAHDCNMRCGYCFAASGTFRGERDLMPLEVAQQAIDFLLWNSGALNRLEVDFFGGEPLLNFEVLKSAVEYGREKAHSVGKEIRFTLTTNCLLLDRETNDFLDRESMRVVLSIDGRAADHNRLRKLKNGSGSHEVVLRRIRDFLAGRRNENYYLRGTYTAWTLNFLENALYLHDLGYCEISMEPVVALPGEPYALREEHLPYLLRQYEDLVCAIDRREEEGRPLRFFHFEVDTAGLSCLSKRLSGCGAGNEYMAVTPSGQLYPCHQFVGREGFLLGTVQAGVMQPEIQEEFRHLSFLENEDCPSCWARYLCSGGCHANAHLLSGNLRKPERLSCLLIRKRMECALYLKMRRKERSKQPNYQRVQHI